MNLIWHIFRKDARHLYPEILITLVFTVAFAWVAPVQWLYAPYGGALASGGVASVLAPLLRVFLPVIWLVLITRLVQDESLVGDRQFWLTRPYAWPVLLAAKALFVLLFLYLPLVAMQVYLLHHAGLDVRAALPDLLYYQLRLTAIFFLPVFAIATVTATFARQFITILAGLAYLGLVTTAGSNLMAVRMAAPGVDTACAVIAALVLLGVVLLQYARRRTRVSRLVLAVLPLLLLLIVVGAPAKMLIERAYPLAAGGYEVRFDGDPRKQQPGSGGPFVANGRVSLLLPVTATGLPAGTRLKIAGAEIEIVTNDGFRWTSPYQNMGREVSGEDGQSAVFVSMPLSVFQRIGNTPVAIDISLPAQKFKTVAAKTFAAEEPGFTVPGRGLCAVLADGSTGDCLYPLRMPPPTEVAASISDTPCPDSAGGTRTVVRTFVASDDTFVAYDFDPVAISRFHFDLPALPPGKMTPDGSYVSASPVRLGFLCPGSTVTVAPRVLAGRERLTLKQSGVVLAPYVRHVVQRAPRYAVQGTEQQ